MKQRLLDASSNMDVEPLDEVGRLMLTIKSGWDSIPLDDRMQALSQQASI